MHPICEKLDKNKPKRTCDKSCKNFKFEWMDTACVLSPVYSVAQGEKCAIYVKRI